MKPSRISGQADLIDKWPETQAMIRDYPWLIEENASYSDDLYRWVKEHLTTEFRARSICGKDSWSQFFFKHRSDAMVFKLTWSGKVDDAMWKNRG